MPRAGRRRSVVWTCFVENTESGKRRVLCRFCQHDIVANPIRMVRHIVKHCPNADEHHKRICREYQTLTVPARRRNGEADANLTGEDESRTVGVSEQVPLHAIDVTTMAMASTPQTTVSSSPSPSLSFSLNHALQFPLAASSIDDTDSHQRPAPSRHPTGADSDIKTSDLAQEEIVLALVSTTGSLELLDNKHFSRALELLHAKPLSQRDALSDVVPRLENQARAEASSFLRAATILTVQFTATSLHDGTSLEWFAADQEHRQVVLDSVSALRGSNLSELITERFRLLPRKPQSPLLICTDIFGEAVSFPSTVSPSQLETPVFTSGCMMQTSLSVLAAVMESVPALQRSIDACVRVSDAVGLHLDQFRRDSQASTDFRSYNVPVEGPSSMVAVLLQVLHYRDLIQDLSAQLPDEVAHIVQQDQFWAEATIARAVLRPFAFLFALSEYGHLHSSLVLTSWLLVVATAANCPNLSQSEKQAVEDAVILHVKSHVEPLSFACLLLDPRCRGVGLSALGKRKVRAMVAEIAAKLDPRVQQSHLLEHLVQFLSKERPFDDESSWQMMASLPRLFWIEFMAEAPELASVALVALGYRPYIRSLQDTWSTLRGMAECRVKMPTQDHSASMNLLAMRTQLQDNRNRDRRHETVDHVARALIAEQPSPEALESSSVELNGAYLEEDDAGAFSQLRGQLQRVVHAFLREKDATSSFSDVEGADASWFAVDSAEALEICLHRALLGEMTYMRSNSTSVSEDGDAGAVEVSSSAGAVAVEVAEASTASDALSGLMDL